MWVNLIISLIISQILLQCIEKFKARLVADGNTQRYGVDFNRIFSTVVKSSTLRLLLSVAAAYDFDLHQVDITQAYLQATVTEDLYMSVPPGVHPFDKSNRPICCKLQRTLYGLRQSGREWGELLASFLLDFGYTRSPIDTCLFTLGQKTSLLWVAIYVDDILVLSNDKALRLRFMDALTKRFPTEDKGELQWLLGLAVTRDRSQRTLSLSQELFVSDITQRFASHISAGHTRRYDAPMQEGLLLDGADSPIMGSPEFDALARCAPARCLPLHCRRHPLACKHDEAGHSIRRITARPFPLQSRHDTLSCSPPRPCLP